MSNPSRHLTPSERRELAKERRSTALSMRCAGMKLHEIGDQLGCSIEQARQLVLKAERLQRDPRWSDRLPARVASLLKRLNLLDRSEAEAAAEIVRLGRRDLLLIQNLGKISVVEIETWLAGLGLAFTDASTVADRTPIERHEKTAA